MPLTTAAAAISSEVVTADIMIGTSVDSSISDRGMFCSFAAARICPNSSLIAGKYRSVVEMAVIKPCGRCKARMAATIFCMEAFRTSKIPAKMQGILYDDAGNLLLADKLQQLLNSGSVQILTGISVILQFNDLQLPQFLISSDVVINQFTLVRDTVAFILVPYIQKVGETSQNGQISVFLDEQNRRCQSQ